ncbi:hypothetical protein ASL11_31605 [Paenibacillus sp. Soil750]|nr:hypothetical protein ASL11_31605 [Paenibacillus sp. Soil750]
MNKKNQWGVGIVGVGGWGGTAHVPALEALENYEVKALTGTRLDTAQAAAERHGIERFYTDVLEMAKQPDVDIVTITVKVPEHDHLIRMALEAGKNVYSEWPLSRTTSESKELLVLAEEQGVNHVVGLQARGNPTVRYIRDLVTRGTVGRVLAVNAVITMPRFPTTNGNVDLAHVYLLDESNGADQLTIGAAHMLDAIEYMVAPFAEVSATLATQYPEVNILETGEVVRATAPDHVTITGKLTQGSIVSAQFINAGTPGFTLKIIGTEGEFIVTPRDGLMFQMDRLNLSFAPTSGKVETLETPDDYFPFVTRDTAPGPGYNVAHLYALFSERINGVEVELPDFADAVRMHRLMDAIRAASVTGIRQTLEE